MQLGLLSGGVNRAPTTPLIAVFTPSPGSTTLQKNMHVAQKPSIDCITCLIPQSSWDANQLEALTNTNLKGQL